MSDGLVYSTEHGEMCPGCGNPVAQCACRRAPGPARRGGVVRVGRETQGRKGKGVTVVTGLRLPGAELEKLARLMKQRCGCGGSVKQGVIEIQGDQRDTIVELLRQEGYEAKKAGG